MNKFASWFYVRINQAMRSRGGRGREDTKKFAQVRIWRICRWLVHKKFSSPTWRKQKNIERKKGNKSDKQYVPSGKFQFFRFSFFLPFSPSIGGRVCRYYLREKYNRDIKRKNAMQTCKTRLRRAKFWRRKILSTLIRIQATKSTPLARFCVNALARLHVFDAAWRFSDSN